MYGLAYARALALIGCADCHRFACGRVAQFTLSVDVTDNEYERSSLMWTREHMHALLDVSPNAVARALLALYRHQTEDERRAGYTTHANGVGFNKRDAEWLSDIARKYLRYGRWASEKQLNAVRGRMKFYSRQLVEMANAKGDPVPDRVEELVRMRRAAQAPTKPAASDVIDVQAREVEEALALCAPAVVDPW